LLASAIADAKAYDVPAFTPFVANRETYAETSTTFHSAVPHRGGIDRATPCDQNFLGPIALRRNAAPLRFKIIWIGRRGRRAVEVESQTSIRHALRSPDDHS
jgi:hypothetical protein